MLYFQNFPELNRGVSRSSRAALSLGRRRERSFFTPNSELVSMRRYLASLSSAVTFLDMEAEAQSPRDYTCKDAVARTLNILWIAQGVGRFVQQNILKNLKQRDLNLVQFRNMKVHLH